MTILKLLYLTDTHIRGTSPRSRLDDFPETLKAKLAESIEIARQYQVAAILHGGDLFDRPDVAPAVAREFLEVLMAAPCPIYGIAGNHDIFGFNPDTVQRTILGLFDGFGLFRLLRPGEITWIDNPDGLRVQVTGQEFHAEIDRRDPWLDYTVVPTGDLSAPPGHQHWRDPSADFAIHLTHGMLLDKPFLPGIAHTTLDKVAGFTAADITFGAHYHPGWPAKEDCNGCLWVHPGAVARLGASAGDIDRMPEVCLVTLERGQRPQVEFIPLKTARPGLEVLDPGKTDDMAREMALAETVAGIEQAEFGGLEVQDILAEIAEAGSVPADVRAEALRRVGLAQEALGRGEEDVA